MQAHYWNSIPTHRSSCGSGSNVFISSVFILCHASASVQRWAGISQWQHLLQLTLLSNLSSQLSWPLSFVGGPNTICVWYHSQRWQWGVCNDPTEVKPWNLKEAEFPGEQHIKDPGLHLWVPRSNSKPLPGWEPGTSDTVVQTTEIGKTLRTVSKERMQFTKRWDVAV